MIALGLTGSIGMGKSTVAAMFRDEGVPLFDADAEVHRLQGPAGALVAAIEAAFPGTTGESGVDRTALGEIALTDPDKLARLEAIVHPAVAEARRAFLDRHRDEHLVVLDIPLLFETSGEALVDEVVVVSASAGTQRDRVLARSGMTEARLTAVLARQLPDADKRARADHVINTGVSLDETRDQVRALIACLRARGARYESRA